MTQRDAYIAKTKQQLDELNAEMTKLEARAHAAKHDALERYRGEMAKLQHQSELAMSKLDELKAASESTWESMVTEMEKVSAAFTHSFSYFKSQL